MKAMVLKQTWDMRENPAPLELADLPIPEPGEGEILIRVATCGVCHTELDEIEGRTPPNEFPRVLGHQVVGWVEGSGQGAGRFRTGERVGVAWIFSACGVCAFCLRGEENLCSEFKATGRDAHGGYAEYMTVPKTFAYPIPEAFSDVEAAPLLCAGAIGYRSLRLTGLMEESGASKDSGQALRLRSGQALGLTGFGASAHIVLKLICYLYPEMEVYVFSRSAGEREFAMELGAAWAGAIQDTAPRPLDAIIDTTPAWLPVVEALRNLAPGGRLVINAIRKEAGDQDSLLELDYPTHLWMEKEIKSVANLTRRDASEFLELAAKVPILPETQEYSLEEANLALSELKNRKIRGAKVLKIE